MVEQALLLIGRTHKAGPEAAHAARDEIARWRDGSPAQANAVAAAQQLWDAADGSVLKDTVPMPRSQADTVKARRAALGLLGVGGFAALLTGGGRWYWQQPVYEVALSTSHGQHIDHKLSDGSELSLAARTTATVVYYRDRREARLESGEIRFKVTADADRPFVVVTEWGQARVLGTVFTVSVRERHMRVAVAEGRVAVWPHRQAGPSGGQGDEPSLVLLAGQAIEADAHGMGTQTTVPPSDVGAWRQGWLVFDNTPLPEALARWNDYLPRALRLADQPRLSALRLSGSFPLRDPQAFLQGLPDILPVRVVRAADGITTIEPR